MAAVELDHAPTLVIEPDRDDAAAAAERDRSTDKRRRLRQDRASCAPPASPPPASPPRSPPLRPRAPSRTWPPPPTSRARPSSSRSCYLVDPHGPAARQVLAGYALAFSSTAGAIRPIPGNFDNEGIVHSAHARGRRHRPPARLRRDLIAQSVGTSTDVNAVALAARRARPSRRSVGSVFRLMLSRRLRARVRRRPRHVRRAHRHRTTSAACAWPWPSTPSTSSPPAAIRSTSTPSSACPCASIACCASAPSTSAQDLEALADDDGDAEGGARHYVGPDVALSLRKNHLLLTGGVAVELAGTPGVLARAALNYVY